MPPVPLALNSQCACFEDRLARLLNEDPYFHSIPKPSFTAVIHLPVNYHHCVNVMLVLQSAVGPGEHDVHSWCRNHREFPIFL